MTRRREAWVEIDLDAIAGNLEVIRRVVGPGVRVAPVVKADAYGHGLVEVASVLGPLADALCVATLDEGLALREAGVAGRIILLYPAPPDAVVEAIRAGIEPTVMSAADASGIVRAVGDGGARSSRVARAQLAIDTGMTRGGVRPEEAVSVARILAASPRVAIAGTWTHLCCPDDPETTAGQVARFEEALAALADAALPAGERHFGASGSIFAATASSSGAASLGAGDLVRPGLAIYGYLGDGLPLATHAGAAAALRPALALKARPVAISDVPAGTSVGYGATWRADRPSRIAIVPVGYGDGYLRATQPGGSVLVAGRRAPIVGIVSMDATCVDVTDVPGVDVDSELVLLGSQGDERIDASELARLRNTIVWEVLSSIAARIGRVYHPRTAAGTARDMTVKPVDSRQERA